MTPLWLPPSRVPTHSTLHSFEILPAFLKRSFVFRLRPYGRKNPCAALASRTFKPARQTSGRGSTAPCGPGGCGRPGLGLVAERTQSGVSSKRPHIPTHPAKRRYPGDPGHRCFRPPDGTDGAAAGFCKTNRCSDPCSNSCYRTRTGAPFNRFTSHQSICFAGSDEHGSPAVR